MRHSERVTQFPGVLERMIATLETENSALRECRPYQIGELSARKSMALYELERLGGMAPPIPALPLVRLGHARKLLDENRTLLRLNMTALGDLIELLHSHQLGDESDGTYSAQSLSRQGGR